MLSSLLRAAPRAWRCTFLVALGCAASASAQTGGSAFSVLRSFTRFTDGATTRSSSRLIQGTNGNLYGTLATGGSFSGGTLFRVSPNGFFFLVLKNFAAADGGVPVALLQSRDGLLYGVCHATGASPQASIFRITPDGADFTVLRRFVGGTDAWLPDNLIEGSDGVLYGAAKAAASNNLGHSIFRMERDGTGFTVLRALAGDEGVDETSLIQGPDGRLYGASLDGGGGTNMGVVFVLNTNGSGFTVLRRFAGPQGRRPNRLAFYDGQIYGTTRQGGPTVDWGVLYRMRPDGSGFTLLHEFRGNFPPTAGEFPLVGVTAMRDGNLYGVTAFGGSLRGFGTLYRYDTAAQKMYFLKQFSVSGADGVEPNTELLAAADGRLYGMTGVGGADAAGTLYTYDLTREGADVGLVGTVGRSFSYTHEFGASASGLPNGLTFSGPVPTVSGTPTQAGVFTITFTGPIGFSTSSNSVTLTVAKGSAQVILSNLTQSHDGTPKRPTVTTIPAGLPVVITYNGSLTAPSEPGSYVIGAAVNDPNYTGLGTGTLVIGSAAPRFTEQLASAEAPAGTTVTLSPKISVTPPATYRWQRKARGEEAFVDLVENATFGGVDTATLTIREPRLTMNGDQFRLIVTNSVGSATSEPTVFSVSPSVKLSNVSVRARVVPGEALTVGVVTSGSRTLLLRGIGPGLATFVGREAAGDPTLLIGSGTNPQLAANDNWNGVPALAAAFTEVGAFALPNDSLDAVVLTPLAGAATARVSVAAAGLVLMEAYDVSGDRFDRLINLSARHAVGADADALVAGFNVVGVGSITLLIRGVGPTLRDFGVTNAIEDPTLQVFRGETQLASNNDWESSVAATARAVGAFPLAAASKDAALLLTVAPGSYTIRLANAQARNGEGLIEIYEVP